MENKSIIVKKLGIFQRIRKNIYLRNMNTNKARKYKELPEYLKNDKDVIDAIINLGDTWINVFDFDIQKNLIKEKSSRIVGISNLKIAAKILNDEPSIVGDLKKYDYAIYNLLYNLLYEKKFESNKDFVKYLPLEEQIKILTDTNIEYNVSELPEEITKNDVVSFEYRTKKKVIKEWTNQFIDKFSPEAIIKIAIEDNKEQRKDNRLEEYDLTKLSVDTQVKLLLISDMYLEKVSDEAKIKFVGNNPLLFDRLSDEILDKMVEEDPTLFGKMPKSYQDKKIKQDIKLIKNTSTNFGFDVKVFDTPEEVKKYLMRSGFPNNKYYTYLNITDVRNNDFIWEMGKFNPSSIELFRSGGSNQWRQDMRNQKLISNFKKVVRDQKGEGVLTEYFEEKERYIPTKDEEISVINRIGKIISNDDMLKKLTQEEILDFAKQPSHEKLVNIIRKTYGDRAAQIIVDRPQITSEIIPNYYIFSNQIIEEFGIGAVHSNLTFEMKSSGILSELARKPEKMQKFKVFKEATKDMFNNSAIDLENKLLDFYFLEDLMDVIDFSKLTENQKENLQTLIMDRTGVRDRDIIDVPKNSEELDTYIERRNQLYDAAIKRENDIKKLKDLIGRRFFGLSYDLSDSRVLSAPSLKGMCKFYNLKNFVNNRITLESENFSVDELDLLEMLTIIDDVKDIRVLKELAKELSTQENIVNPVFFKDLKEKVPMQYNQEMISSLMTPEKAEEMVEKGEQGIKVRTDDETGVKVISLEGADFKMYVTNPFLNNSNVKRVRGLDEAIDTWKEFENGIATFSGCFIDQGEIKSTLDAGEIGFGFFNVKPNQIVAMGTTDVHVSHCRRELETTTTEVRAIDYDYSEEFMRKTTERLEYKDPHYDPNHPYNEVASLRTDKDISEIKENTYGGKIIPDYVVIIGKATPSLIQKVNEIGIKHIFEIDKEQYKDRSWSRINSKEPEQTPRTETDRMKRIKEIANQDER